MPDVYTITPLETFAKEVIPAVADLQAHAGDDLLLLKP
jgi:hypothetical protein